MDIGFDEGCFQSKSACKNYQHNLINKGNSPWSGLQVVASSWRAETVETPVDPL